MPAKITVTLKCGECGKQTVSRGLPNPNVRRRPAAFALEVFTIDWEEPDEDGEAGSVSVRRGIWSDCIDNKEDCLCSIACAVKMVERLLRRMYGKPKRGRGKRCRSAKRK
jgi:hypothetical protein